MRVSRYPQEWIDRTKAFDTREWPVLCNSCGDIVAARVKEYNTLLAYMSPAEALNEMKIFLECTRFSFLVPYNVVPDFEAIATGANNDGEVVNVSEIVKNLSGLGVSPDDRGNSADVGKDTDISPINNFPSEIGVPVINKDSRYSDYSVNKGGATLMYTTGSTYFCQFSTE